MYSRVLDILLSLNDRPQMPQDKRYDLSLPVPAGATDDCILPIDKEPLQGPQPTKRLRDLIEVVPHLNFAQTREKFPAETQELLTGIDSPAAAPSLQQNPPTFLTADDIDNYLWEVDNEIVREPDVYGGPIELLPTLAPLARDQLNGRGATPSMTMPKGGTAAGASSINTASRDFALRNPTSVYNWLRKHHPKTFLQDHEGGDDEKDKGGDKSHHRKVARGDDDDDDDERRSSARKGAGGGVRKSGGKDPASIAVARAKAKTERSAKKATPKDKRKSLDAPMLDGEDEVAYDEPASNKGAKRKRPADDDTGYRPKGGSSRRPAKKRTKNNSIGGSSAIEAPVGITGMDEKVEAEVAVAKPDTFHILDQVEAAAGRAETDG